MEKIFREVKTKPRLSENQNINFAPHVHDDVELVYVRRGGGDALCDGTRYRLCPGSIFLAFPNQIHSYENCADGKYIVLIIKPSRLLYLQDTFVQTLPTEAVCMAEPSLTKPLEQALQEYTIQGDSCVVDGYLTVFFGKLFPLLQLEKHAVPNDRISLILQYCGSHFREGICVQELCDQLHVSRSYVSHLFSNRLKIPFSDYINALRLNEAVSLLEGTVLNVTQEGEQAGFPTIRTFNRVFRKQFGCAPSEYRKKRSSDPKQMQTQR